MKKYIAAIYAKSEAIHSPQYLVDCMEMALSWDEATGICELPDDADARLSGYPPPPDDWWLTYRKKHQLGTKIKTFLSLFKIKPCRGCDKRADYLDGKPSH
jgi:hypothetical protein